MINFSTQQLEAIESLAAGKSCGEAAEQAQVTPTTVSRWRRDREFNEEVSRRAKEILRDRLPKLYDIAADKAEEGSPAHLKIILDHLDKLEEIANRNQDYNISFTWMPDAPDSN